MEAEKILKDNGIKITTLRLKLIQILIKNEKAMSCDEILKELKANKTTVYRSFELFESCGIVIKIQWDQKSYYELANGSRAYLACDICKELKSIELPKIKESKFIKSALISGRCNLCQVK